MTQDKSNENTEPENELQPENEEAFSHFSYLRQLIFSKTVLIPLIISAFSLVITTISRFSSGFAESYSQSVGSFIRMVLAKITGVFPFSVAETLLAFFVIFLIYSLCRSVYAIIKKSESFEFEDKANKALICVFLIAFALYNFSFAPSNHTPPIEKYLNLETNPLSAKQLYDCISEVSDELKICLDNGDIRHTPDGLTCMPYSYNELNDVLNGVYRNSYEKYPFLSRFDSVAKRIMLSPLMTYTHISGIYVPFTGEININTNYPDYVIVFSQAHEMAHQRGVAREDEANFVAFLVLYESDDYYLKYCALSELYDYLSDALFYADKDLFYDALISTDRRVIYEMLGFNEFFAPYQNSAVSAVAGAVNDASIKLRGDSDGVNSYDKMIELAVSYFENR